MCAIYSWVLVLTFNYRHMAKNKWMIKDVDRDRECQRLMDLGLLNKETMNVTNIYKLVSDDMGNIDPRKEHVVLKGVEFKCGICRYNKSFSLEDNEVRLLLRENNKSNVFDFECPECKSMKQLQLHTTDTVGIGEEYWITVETISEAMEYKNNPDLGWSSMTVKEVIIEPILNKMEGKKNIKKKGEMKWWHIWRLLETS